MNAGAKYWIAKYVDDPFRDEPRNVGVIIEHNGVFAARFFGEREDGVFDARRIRSKFLYPNVYSQWRDFWRQKIREKDLSAILKGSTANFFVREGGEVTDTGSDNSAEICHFLYTLLVGSGAIEAFNWTDKDENDVGLADEITRALEDIHVLATSEDKNLFRRRHPVVVNQHVTGEKVTHTPSFSQLNSHLYVIDWINLSSSHVNKTKERAGYMAYMFDDIKNVHPDAEAYSIVRPETNEGVEQIEYAKAILRSGSHIVNWSDPQDRGQFLEERDRIAA
jgi:hypothetical protein